MKVHMQQGFAGLTDFDFEQGMVLLRRARTPLGFKRVVSGSCAGNELDGAEGGRGETHGEAVAMARGGRCWTRVAVLEVVRELSSRHVLKAGPQGISEEPGKPCHVDF